jgi:hypothetical protein
MLFREIIPVYYENHIRNINVLRGENAGLLNIKANGTYSYHCRLSVKGTGQSNGPVIRNRDCKYEI